MLGRGQMYEGYDRPNVSTGWRFVHYYTGSGTYGREGTPQPCDSRAGHGERGGDWSKVGRSGVRGPPGPRDSARPPLTRIHHTRLRPTVRSSRPLQQRRRSRSRQHQRCCSLPAVPVPDSPSVRRLRPGQLALAGDRALAHTQVRSPSRTGRGCCEPDQPNTLVPRFHARGRWWRGRLLDRRLAHSNHCALVGHGSAGIGARPGGGSSSARAAIPWR